MIDLSFEQKKTLSSFFSNISVLFFGAALVSPTVIGLASLVTQAKYLVDGAMFLVLSLVVLEE